MLFTPMQIVFKTLDLRAQKVMSRQRLDINFVGPLQLHYRPYVPQAYKPKPPKKARAFDSDNWK